MKPADLHVEDLDAASVVAVARHAARVEMGGEARARVFASRGYVEIMIEDSLPVYGVTTGFGALANTRICLLYTSPSPRDYAAARMPSSA